jgi:hypothetical protein
MPSITHGQLNYSLVRRGHSTSPDTLVKLTVAGFAHLPEHGSLVDMFLAVLNELASRRAEAAYDPHQVIDVIVSGSQLLDQLGISSHSLAAILPDILGGEPATWHGSGQVDAGDWKHNVSTFVRRFRAVSDVDDYLRRLRAFIVPAAPVAEPVVVSPLGLGAAFDYLNVVWRLRFGDGLLASPSVERSARLAFDATSAEEFDNRPSALGELFKGFDPPGDESQGSLQRLRAFLGGNLSAEAMARVEPALATLRSATDVRNAGQHIDAAADAATALPLLGLTTDHRLQPCLADRSAARDAGAGHDPAGGAGHAAAVVRTPSVGGAQRGPPSWLQPATARREHGPAGLRRWGAAGARPVGIDGCTTPVDLDELNLIPIEPAVVLCVVPGHGRLRCRDQRPASRRSLTRAIHGKGAFPRFRDRLHRHYPAVDDPPPLIGVELVRPRPLLRRGTAGASSPQPAAAGRPAR